MDQARVVILNEKWIQKQNKCKLCFQYCRYEYGDEKRTTQFGYRFIWRKQDGTLQGARGQARIPSLADIQYLTGMALSDGWGHYKNDNRGFSF